MTRLALPIVAGLALVGCVANPSGSDEIAVASSDDACRLSAAEAPSGTVVFSVRNDGSEVTEFYLLAEDGVRVVGEVENIGPGLTRELVVQVAPGDYVAACKPGMVGDGIRSDFRVTDSGAPIESSADREVLLDEAAEDYLDFVREEIEELVEETEDFALLYAAGDDDARALYPDARVHWERVEPIAEAFGDLDPAIDAREADLLEGEPFTGWHRIEKDLWAPAGDSALNPEERQALADRLVADTATLAERVGDESFAIEPFQIGNGAKELMDEVASGKVTGEEEFWSHTDLWDFQANVDGARVAFEVLRPVVGRTDPELVDELERRFDELQDLLAQYGSIADGFVPYDELTDGDVLPLSRAVDALGEPLSQLTAAALG